MSYREEMHSVECYAHALQCALENLRDDCKRWPEGDFMFNVRTRNENTLVEWADMYLDPEQVGFNDNICKCSVRGSMAFDLNIPIEVLNDEQRSRFEERQVQADQDAAEQHAEENFVPWSDADRAADFGDLLG